MDIEKLIERLKNAAGGPDGIKMCQQAATALFALRAENKRLKNKLSELAHLPFDEPGVGELTRLMAENEKFRSDLLRLQIERDTLLTANQHLREEREQLTAERDAAVADLTFAVNKYRLFTTDINLCYLCKFNFPSSGENEQTYECPGCYGDDCFEWRGPQKED